MSDEKYPVVFASDEEEAAYIEDLTAIDTGVPKPTIAKLSYRHMRLMDFMIRNPHMRLGEIADHLNYSQSWVSIVVNSDLFAAEFQRRRSAFEQIDSRVISDKITRLANLGLDGMIEALEREPNGEEGEEGPTFTQFQRATELALKSAGYLNAPKEKTTVNVNIQQNQNSVNPDVLARAKALMMQPIVVQQSESSTEGGDNESGI